MTNAAVSGAESVAPSELHKELQEDASFQIKKPSNWVLLVAALILLFTGSYDSIISKLMNRQVTPPCTGCEPRYFEAPFWQTLTMYIGELLCLFAFYIDKGLAKRQGRRPRLDFPASAKSFTKPPCPKYWWIVPTVIDFCASTMINYAFILSQVSTAQLLRNFNVVVTAVLSVIYLRVGLRRHQILGVFVVTVGLIMTGIYALMNPDSANNYEHLQWLGIVMALVGTFLSAFQFVFEESLFRKYQVSPLEAVGLMGLFGCTIGVILLVILEFAGVEKTSETFYMIFSGTREGTILIVTNLTYFISVAGFNASGLMVTKMASGLLRTILIAARTLTIWIIELIIGWNYFVALNFIGLLVVLGGVLTYNYNYMAKEASWSGDLWLRKALLCCGARDPDALVEDASTDASVAQKEKSAA